MFVVTTDCRITRKYMNGASVCFYNYIIHTGFNPYKKTKREQQKLIYSKK